MSLAETPLGARSVPTAAAYALSALMVAAAAALAVAVETLAPAPNVSLIFVLPVVVAAVVFGLGPSLAAAGLSVIACNFFLIAPRYSLRVADPANLWGLGLLMVVAAIVSAVAAAARQRAVAAAEAASQASAVRGLARDLMAETDRAGVAQRCATALSELFDAPAVVVLGEADSALAEYGARTGPLGAADLEAARWVMASGLATRAGAYPAGEARFDFWPLKTARREAVALGVTISGGDAGRPAAPERLVETVTGYLAVALDREAYARQVMQAQVRAEGDRLKADILAAVSHDLRTPLSTVLFTLQSLQRFGEAHEPAVRNELLAGAEAETRRLSSMVESLLDMSRIEAGAVAPRLAQVSLAELVAVAVARNVAALGERALLDGSEDLSVRVDAALFETALANVIENAAKYSPQGSTIELRSGRDAGLAFIEVLDKGPGFGGRAEALFGQFVRGHEGDGRPPGVGLGLAIARSFIEAQGGRVEAADRPEGGACVRLSVPLAAA